MADLQIDNAVDKALEILGSDETGAEPAASKSTEDQVLERLDAGDSVSNEAKGETEADTTAEAVEAEKPAQAVAETPIDPPASWKAEWKDKFQALPRDLQQIVTERESERERGLTKSQQESAEARKAAEAEAAAVQDERKAYANRLNVLIDVTNTMDPVIAEGRKTDWGKALRDDPLGAPAKKYDYEQREMQLSRLANERETVLQKVKFENYQRGDKALREQLPDIWTDDGKRKAFQSQFAKYLTENGFTAEEAGSIQDHRAIIQGRKAMLYDQLMAQQTKIAEKKAVPAPTKVVRVQSNDDGTGNARAEALAKRAMKTGRTDDIADAILARL